MSLQEAVERAGSFEALLPHLRAGGILARADHFRYWDGAPVKLPSRDIDPVLWDAVCSNDPARGRVGFEMGPYDIDIIAIGVELERAAVEALFPAMTVPEPVTPKPPTPEPVRSKGGARRSVLWDKIEPHFDSVVGGAGPFPSLGSARESVRLWLKEKKLASLHNRTIERHINKHRRHWFLEGHKGA